jgi:hypothetical protein
MRFIESALRCGETSIIGVVAGTLNPGLGRRAGDCLWQEPDGLAEDFSLPANLLWTMAKALT